MAGWVENFFKGGVAPGVVAGLLVAVILWVWKRFLWSQQGRRHRPEEIIPRFTRSPSDDSSVNPVLRGPPPNTDLHMQSGHSVPGHEHVVNIHDRSSLVGRPAADHGLPDVNATRSSSRQSENASPLTLSSDRMSAEVEENGGFIRLTSEDEWAFLKPRIVTALDRVTRKFDTSASTSEVLELTEFVPQSSVQGRQEISQSGMRKRKLSGIGGSYLLETLDLSNGLNMKTSSKSFRLVDCERLTGLPDTLPDTLKKMAALKIHDLLCLKSLKTLQTFNLSNCESCTVSSKTIQNLVNLENLNLPSSKGFKTPVSPNFRSLKTLDLLNFRSLKTLDFSNCKNLTRLPKAIENLVSLETLNFSSCKSLKTLDLSKCKSLKTLDLSNCKSLTRLPKTIENLTSVNIIMK